MVLLARTARLRGPARWASVRAAATTSQYRPLPEPSVGWRVDEVDDAQRVARAKNMPFDAAAAAGLAALHANITEARQARARLEAEQSSIMDKITSLAKTQRGSPALEALRQTAREVRTQLRELEKELASTNAQSLAVRSAWPNRVHPAVPIGPESRSAVVRVVDARAPSAIAEPLPAWTLPCSQAEFDAQADGCAALQPDASRDHVALAQAMAGGRISLNAGLTSTGPSWPYLLGTMSMLEHAVCQYALSTVLRHGFLPASVPDVVKTDVAERCGFRPRDEVAAQTYFVDTRRDTDADASALCLVGTAEISLAALVAKQMFATAEAPRDVSPDGVPMTLPVKLAALGHAFRAEAGARGADTRGLYRVHQFSKVEMFVVSEAHRSDEMLEALRRVQEDIVQGLGLLYRVLNMSSEELGASAYQKYDIEAWMPGRGSWGEICSASNCTDYQSRRLAIKYKAGGQNHYAHTLNATAAAVPRLMVALLETYADKQLVLPTTLQPFWLGGPHDPQVRWVAPRSHTAPPTGPAPAPGPPGHTRRFHSSARAMSATDRARAQLRALAARTGADPAPLIMAFLLLHELTAILPLFLIAAALAATGAGDAMLHALDSVWQTYVPHDNEAWQSWLAKGQKVATRLNTKMHDWLPGAQDTSASVWITSFTAAYVAVKLLLPLRVAASVALAPVTARTLLMPLWRRWAPKRSP